MSLLDKKHVSLFPGFLVFQYPSLLVCLFACFLGNVFPGKRVFWFPGFLRVVLTLWIASARYRVGKRYFYLRLAYTASPFPFLKWVLIVCGSGWGCVSGKPLSLTT